MPTINNMGNIFKKFVFCAVKQFILVENAITTPFAPLGQFHCGLYKLLTEQKNWWREHFSTNIHVRNGIGLTAQNFYNIKMSLILKYAYIL
jgi:hypothetical protein